MKGIFLSLAMAAICSTDFAFTANANSFSDSALSTAVYAAVLIIASGAISFMIAARVSGLDKSITVLSVKINSYCG